MRPEQWMLNRGAGKCGRCGKTPVEGKSMCQACIDDLRYSQAAYRFRHKEKLQQFHKNRYWERVSAGLCVQCGKAPPEENKRRCAACGEAVAEASRNTRRKKAIKNARV